jgi:hypothetical protein
MIRIKSKLFYGGIANYFAILNVDELNNGYLSYFYFNNGISVPINYDDRLQRIKKNTEEYCIKNEINLK